MADKIFFYEGIHVRDVVHVLWQNKGKILAVMFLSVILGVVYILMARPLYLSKAVVAPKESGSSSSNLLSQLGGLGGAGASNLSWFAVILNTSGISESVVAENPDVLAFLYPKYWDASRKRWNVDSTKIPDRMSAAAKLRRDYLSISEDSKRGLLTIAVEATPPDLAMRLVTSYMEALTRHVKSNVITDAEASRSYLDSLAQTTHDPLMLQKISALAGSEIEKVLLVRSSPLQILDPPAIPGKPAKPRKSRIILACIVLGFVISSAAIILWNLRELRR